MLKMIIYESFLHQYFNVRDNDAFFNEGNQTPFLFLPSKEAYIKAGRKQSLSKSSQLWKDSVVFFSGHKNIRDADGKIFSVPVENNKFDSIFKDTVMTINNCRVSTEIFEKEGLMGVNKNKTCVFDELGNRVMVECD